MNRKTRNRKIKRKYTARDRKLNTLRKNGGVIGVTCGNRWKRLGNEYDHVKVAKNNLAQTTTYYTIVMNLKKKKREIVVNFKDIKKFKDKLKEKKINGDPIFKNIDDYKLDNIHLRGNKENCVNRFRQIEEFFAYINGLYGENIQFIDDINRNEIILDNCFYELVIENKIKFEKTTK